MIEQTIPNNIPFVAKFLYSKIWYVLKANEDTTAVMSLGTYKRSAEQITNRKHNIFEEFLKQYQEQKDGD